MRNDSASRMTPGPLDSSSPTSQVHSQGTKCPSPGGTSDGRDQRLQDLPLLRTMTPNPRNSMSITNTKGLLNMPGQNNCFLNSAVQVLWHLDIFRRSFRELTGHACMAESCIFCALKELFAQFQYSQESALPPDALRRALAETFCDQRRFQLGFMDDAAECFENILLRIHFHIANKESEDMCSAGHCIPHQKFAMTLVEQTVCHECGATSEPLPFTQMVHYVPTSALCSQAKTLKNEKDESSGFGELLKRAGGFGDLRDCPSSCGTVIQIRKSLMNRPEIVSIGLVWDSERPTIDHIMDVFHIIGMTLKLQDVFHSVVDNRWAASATHQLVGIVTYYGKHYSTFFFHTKLRVWIYFDDAAVREIGPKWEQVVEKCCRGHFQPLLLLYADPHGTSVSTSTAPHGVTIVSGHKKSFSGKDMFGLFKVADKFHQAHHVLPMDNQRRAVTPNPETSFDVNVNIQPRRAVTPSGEFSHSSDIKTDISDKSKHTMEPVKQIHLVPSNSSISKVNLIQNLPFSMPNYFIYKHEFWPSKHTNTNAGNLNKASQLPDKLSNEISHAVIAQNAQFLNNTLQNSNTQKSGTDVSSIVCVQGNTLTNDVSRAFTLLNPPISNCSNIPFQGFPNNSSNSDYEDDPYINRRTVENVLQLQKLQKQKSVGGKHNHMCLGPRNSNSSLDSLDNICLVQDRNVNNFLGLKFDIPDSINIPRRRDSGNWSGDRNSASSSSTTSLDNPYSYAVGNKRALNSRVINKASVSDSIASTDPGYDSFSLSSSDSYPSMLAFAPGKSDLRLGQILENQQSTFISSDLSQFQNSSQEGLKNHETHFYGFRDECEKLCIEADTFLAKSVERENIGDISMAALLSDSAAAKARAAMDVPYCNPKSLSLAKLKHSMCIVRSCNLHKKLKEAVAIAEQRKLEPLSKLHKNYVVGHDLKPGDFFSVGKLSPADKSANLTSKEQKASCHTCREAAYENSGKTIEIYATLPKKSLKKKGGLISFMELLTNEDSCIEKSSRQKNTAETEENNLGHTPHQNINTRVNSHMPWKCNNSESNSTKSLGSKKKQCNFGKPQTRDSDLSDYSSEWEGTQKCSLHRTYSGPPLKGKGTSGEPVEENQTYSGHPMKKQHRIRRKLMGGFMKRKNRSLPDLREGQDQLNSLSRSFDDSTMYQTPLQVRKINDKSIKSVNCINDISIMFQKNKQLTSENMQNNSMLPLEISEGSKAGVKCTTKVVSSRTHTPPPYKPPPPIAGIEFDTSFKKVFAHKKEVCKSHSIASVGVHSNTSYRNALPDDISNKHLHYTSNDKLNTQNCLAYSVSLSNKAEYNLNSFRNNQKMPKGNIVWLKELQKKQEEIFQKKKLKEDLLKHHKHLKENSSMLCLGNTAYQRNCELKRDDILQLHLSLKHDRKNNTLHSSEDNLSTSNKETVINSLSENDQPNSVKYLASKFEKILKPVCGVTDFSDDLVTSSSADKNSVLPASEYVPVKSDVCMDLNDKLQSHESMRESDKDQIFAKDQENIDKDQFPILFNTVSLNTHNTHTTDRQFTNILQIGTNVCAFKSTNLPVQNCKDTGLQKSNHEISVQLETRRPDKPPDYETAIQRLELIRSDKNLMRQLENNHILNVESTIFEQDKRKRGSKKSVTFSDKVVLVACAGDEDSDFIPNPLLERVYKQHLLQNSSTDIGAKNVTECVQNTSDNSKSTLHNDILSRTSKLLHPDTMQQPCNLCHHKTVSTPNIYCPDCAFYMSRFQS